MRRLILSIALAAAWALPSAALAQYVVDGTRGSDSARGTAAAPWKTLDHARKNAPGGSTVTVRAGSYPAFVETEVPAGRTNWVTFVNAPGADVQIAGVALVYPGLQNVYLRFDGFDIRSSSTAVVEIFQARHVTFEDSRVRGTQWWVNDRLGRNGFDIERSQNIQVGTIRGEPLANHGNWIHEVHRGVQVNRSSDVTVAGNLIQVKAGSGIQWLDDNTRGQIRGNHITGETPDGNPKLAAAAHASIISVRSSDLLISGNQLHGMGSSSGIMTYEPDGAGGDPAYHDIVIENNALYDTHSQALRFSNLGLNVTVRNNLIAPRYRKVPPGTANQCAPFDADGIGVIRDNRHRHYVALTVHTTAGAHSLRLHNNVFIGTVNVPGAGVEDLNNITWSMQRGGAWVTSGLNRLTGTQVLHHTAGTGCGSHDKRFEDGSFFAEPGLNFHFPGSPVINWRLAPTSSALNFGNPDLDPEDSLGTLDASGAYLLNNGPRRDDTHHSAGPSER